MTAEELLTVNPLLAVKMAAAEQIGHPATPDWFVIRSIKSNSNIQEAIIELELNELFVPFHYRSTVSQPIEFRINKLDISLLSKDNPLKLKLSSIFFNKTYADLIREKFDHVSLVIDDSDIEEKTPSPSDVVISASNKSIRWYGSIDVAMELVVENISRFIKRSDVVIDHTKDFNEDGLLNDLIQGLNRINLTELPVAISQSGVVFDTGVVESISNEVDKVNTSIDLKFSYPYSGVHKVNYNRRSFYRTFNDPVNIKAFGDLTIEDILEKINEKLNSSIELNELEDFEIPKVELRGETVLVEDRFMLSIKETSIAHFGDIWITLERDYDD